MKGWTSQAVAALAKEKATTRTSARKKEPKSEPPTDLFQIFCNSEGLPMPKREYKFHPTRNWRIDYYFESGGKRIGLEVEGGAHSGGRHTRGVGFIADIEKYNQFTVHGIWLLRVVPGELKKMKTIKLIKQVLGV